MKINTISTWMLLATAGVLASCLYNSFPSGCDTGASLQIVLIDSADCNLKNGKIQVAVIGGTGSYRYRLESNVPQDSPVFSGLGSGNYKVTAISSSNCEYTADAIVKNKSGVNMSVKVEPSGCMTSSGSVTIETIGGLPPFKFQLGDGALQATSTFTNLMRGNYTVLVRDSTGCEISEVVTLSSGIKFSEVSQIIGSNCAISGCHGNTIFPRLQSYDDIHNNASRIRKQVSDRTMPPGSPLLQEQINKIECWIDDGSPQN